MMLINSNESNMIGWWVSAVKHEQWNMSTLMLVYLLSISQHEHGQTVKASTADGVMTLFALVKLKCWSESCSVHFWEPGEVSHIPTLMNPALPACCKAWSQTLWWLITSSQNKLCIWKRATQPFLKNINQILVVIFIWLCSKQEKLFDIMYDIIQRC